MWDLLEDWYGLWEIPIITRDAPPELQGVGDQRTVVLVALRRLIALGLIQVGVRPWLSDKPPTIASESDAAALLDAHGSWGPPNGKEDEVVVTATPLGDRMFHDRGTA